MGGLNATVGLSLPGAARWERLVVTELVEGAAVDPDQPAVVFDGKRKTYRELRDASRRLTNALVGLGVEEFDRVAVLSANSLEFLELEFGIAAARAIMVPLNWRLRAPELAALLRRSHARTIFVQERFAPTIIELRRSGALPDLRTVISLDGGLGDLSYLELCSSSSLARPTRSGRLEDPHEIIFTSGTAGQPKGVVWTNGTVLWNSIQQVMDFSLSAEDSTYAISDMHYIAGRHDLTLPILHQGGTVHVKPSSNFDAGEVLDYVAEHGITRVLWVPTMLYEILRVPNLQARDLSRLRMIMCGGQPLSVNTVKRAVRAFPQAAFVQVYGLTEGGGTVTRMRPGDVVKRPGSAGRAATHAEIRILDSEGLEQPPGADGEIVVRAPTVTPGYWEDPELTERLISDGWLHTGDVGRLDEDGFLYVSGRKSDTIISGAMHIFPAEIEEILLEHPCVAEAAVIGIPHDKWGETVCAVIVPAPGAQIDERALTALCSERLASFKKPSAFRVVSELPRTGSGKPRKFILRERFAR
jgi:fatty-acyl-CoA synthase